jgi:hypothetical protein
MSSSKLTNPLSESSSIRNECSTSRFLNVLFAFSSLMLIIIAEYYLFHSRIAEDCPQIRRTISLSDRLMNFRYDDELEQRAERFEESFGVGGEKMFVRSCDSTRRNCDSEVICSGFWSQG